MKKIVITTPLAPLDDTQRIYYDRMIITHKMLKDYLENNGYKTILAYASNDWKALRYVRNKFLEHGIDIETIDTKPYEPEHTRQRLFKIAANREALRRFFCHHTDAEINIMYDADVYCPTPEPIKKLYIDPIERNEADLVFSTHVGYIHGARRHVMCSITYNTSVLMRPEFIPELQEKPEIWLEENTFTREIMRIFNEWCIRYTGKQCIRIKNITNPYCYHKLNKKPGTL